MIKAKKGVLEVKGDYTTLMAEFIQITEMVYHKMLIGKMGFSEDNAREQIYDSLRLAFADDDCKKQVQKNIIAEKIEKLKKELVDEVSD